MWKETRVSPLIKQSIDKEKTNEMDAVCWGRDHGYTISVLTSLAFPKFDSLGGHGDGFAISNLIFISMRMDGNES